MDAAGTAPDVELVRAENPGPLTLEGTNTWLVGRDPCWVVDPGPELDEHAAAVLAAVAARGGLGGVVLTHGHQDHVGGLAALLAGAGSRETPVGSALRDEHPAPAAARPVRLRTGESLGPFSVLATPGHAVEHLAFLIAGPGETSVEAFTGDAVLGRGSVFVGPFPGAMTGYLDALAELRARRPARLRPGHGPVVEDADAHLAGYLEHRAARETALLDALAAGARSVDELLDAAWAEVPEALRGAAALTLEAHLGRLAEGGRVPPGVERRDYAELLAHAEP